jgi:hypothetical protein
VKAAETYSTKRDDRVMQLLPLKVMENETQIRRKWSGATQSSNG